MGANPAGLIGVIRDEIYSSVFSSGVCSDVFAIAALELEPLIGVMNIISLG